MECAVAESNPPGEQTWLALLRQDAEGDRGAAMRRLARLAAAAHRRAEAEQAEAADPVEAQSIHATEAAETGAGTGDAMAAEASVEAIGSITPARRKEASR